MTYGGKLWSFVPKESKKGELRAERNAPLQQLAQARPPFPGQKRWSGRLVDWGLNCFAFHFRTTFLAGRPITEVFY